MTADAATWPASPSVLVVMPTYNERENLETTVGGVFRHCPQVHVLVVDDNSPDGTGRLADAMAESDGRVHVLHRREKNGLGPAYLAGFTWALDHGYDVICEMDMDGSHRPQDLARLVALSCREPDVDLVIGSRRVPGGRMENWPWYRDLISRGGSWYARTMLGIRVFDMTAGFRAYHASMLRRIDFADVESGGYVFQIDMTRHVVAAGGTIRELPITFVQRARGVSKMSSAIVVEAMVRVTQWGIRRMFI
ncbi:dolichol-phosphate mannosyltransferase [Bifidobacterium primatium]|uniref:Dolichol-phosphate mannosyltransferase n=1 Tax=Bifidobacterium primatium TaxID=2045438 RepID=A0A2M9HBX6_9BIFI|nr:polyprenol monophosphomannose synthase [Bifidobacterium primatium]PJM74313.1 dolichol-phosphate mannosyltransferase [Bifidobacterium primatium]